MAPPSGLVWADDEDDEPAFACLIGNVPTSLAEADVRDLIGELKVMTPLREISPLFRARCFKTPCESVRHHPPRLRLLRADLWPACDRGRARACAHMARGAYDGGGPQVGHQHHERGACVWAHPKDRPICLPYLVCISASERLHL